MFTPLLDVVLAILFIVLIVYAFVAKGLENEENHQPIIDVKQYNHLVKTDEKRRVDISVLDIDGDSVKLNLLEKGKIANLKKIRNNRFKLEIDSTMRLLGQKKIYKALNYTLIAEDSFGGLDTAKISLLVFDKKMADGWSPLPLPKDSILFECVAIDNNKVKIYNTMHKYKKYIGRILTIKEIKKYFHEAIREDYSNKFYSHKIRLSPGTVKASTKDNLKFKLMNLKYDPMEYQKIFHYILD